MVPWMANTYLGDQPIVNTTHSPTSTALHRLGPPSTALQLWRHPRPGLRRPLLGVRQLLVQVLQQLELPLLDVPQLVPLLVAQRVELVVQVPDLELRHQVDLVVLLRLQPVLLRLPVLAHHDDGRLNRGERGEHQVQEDIGIRVERMTGQDPGVERHPTQEHRAEDEDERPAPAEVRNSVGQVLAERHVRLEFRVHQLRHATAARDLRHQRLLDLRHLLVFGLEVVQELLGPVLLETLAADPSRRLPLRPLPFDDLEDLVLHLLRRYQPAAVDGALAQGAVELGHGRPFYSRAGAVIPKTLTRKAQRSACSSISLLVGLPAPWPALVSIWMSTGADPACAACSAAANLKECPGTTRSSWSAVVISVAG